MIDLLCVLPLYGENCEDVSLRMISSLAVQKTKYNVEYQIYVDNTVSSDTVKQLIMLFNSRSISFKVNYCDDNTSSGSKRNKGLAYAKDWAKYIWFLDQDDYLLKNNTFDTILDKCYSTDADIVRINYDIPDTVNDYNSKTIRTIITMPWQFIFKTENVQKYSFREDCEYGSDLTFVVKYLIDNEYYRFVAKGLSMYEYKNIVNIPDKLYFYDYLNTNSCMGKFARSTSDDKQNVVKYATEILQNIKDGHENN